MCKTEAPASVDVACTTHGHFVPWLAAAKGTIVLSAYQANKLAFISVRDSEVQLLMREMDKPMGIAFAQNRLFVSCRQDITIFANDARMASSYRGKSGSSGTYDALFLPRLSYHLNDNFVHDMAVGKGGLVFTNTRFNCLATVSAEYSFEHLWHPDFVTEMSPEDRCHLNGLCLCDGRVRYMTALGRGNSHRSWNADKSSGGVLIEVPSSKVLLEGLCMPHSPRWVGDRLYFLNSGRGELCCWRPGETQWQVVGQLNGFLRGLTVVGSYALVGLSKIREKKTFNGLPVAADGAELCCGIAVVELATGREVGRFEFTAGCTETFDLLFLPGIVRANILTSHAEAARNAYPVKEGAFWLKHEK